MQVAAMLLQMALRQAHLPRQRKQLQRTATTMMTGVHRCWTLRSGEGGVLVGREWDRAGRQLCARHSLTLLLHCSLCRGHLGVAKLLVARGADPKVSEGILGHTALHRVSRLILHPLSYCPTTPFLYHLLPSLHSLAFAPPEPTPTTHSHPHSTMHTPSLITPGSGRWPRSRCRLACRRGWL